MSRVVTTLLQTDAAVLEHTVASGARLLVADGAIVAIAHDDTAADRRQRIAGTVCPGFVDLQVNGAGGASAHEATPAALATIARAVWDGGAVAFLPTLITAPFEELLRQTAALARCIETFAGAGATPLGIHLEGPFLEASGAHRDELFVDPTPARVDALLDAARGTLRLVTLAPARPGAADAVRRLTAAGVAVALGHAHATAGMAECIAAGARLVTHLFNAMSPLHHRDVGVAGLALDDERLSCSMILDGVHVHPAMVRNAWRCLGPQRLVLISDAIAAAGMPDGDYRLGTTPVTLRAGAVRDAQGRLAGSALTLGKAASNLLAWVPQCGPWTAARVAARNPAALIGAATLGAIAPGRAARFSVRTAAGWHCLAIQ
jgi:N-acetylglucosamine-6-phosphate deacetylase